MRTRISRFDQSVIPVTRKPRAAAIADLHRFMGSRRALNTPLSQRQAIRSPGDIRRSWYQGASQVTRIHFYLAYRFCRNKPREEDGVVLPLHVQLENPTLRSMMKTLHFPLAVLRAWCSLSTACLWRVNSARRDLYAGRPATGAFTSVASIKKRSSIFGRCRHA